MKREREADRHTDRCRQLCNDQEVDGMSAEFVTPAGRCMLKYDKGLDNVRQ